MSFGFSLADCWAWLRYIPAISAARRLRLRDEWTSLHAHHKAILSGDFGVGFTTWALHQALGFVRYSDTIWVVNTLAPGSFALASGAKRGPQKSPDYIAHDAAGNASVLECKGTQTSRKALYDQLSTGVPQKRSLRTVGATDLQHSLVAGLYIPQWGAKEDALLAICDPEWTDIKKVLGRFPSGTLARGVVQVAVAKELAFFELAQTANALVKVKGARESIKAAITEDLQSTSVEGRERSPDGLRISRGYTWPHSVQLEEGVGIVGARFTALLPETQIEALHQLDAPDEEGERQQDQQAKQSWSAGRSPTTASLVSPMGVRYELELLSG